jgi:isopentenyl-diphosphate Delta-isomerase
VDYILIIVADVDLNVNPNEVRDTRYVSPEELKEMFQQPGMTLSNALTQTWNSLPGSS